jgi:predicted alpha/beta-hydrolase family hydrolase
MSGPEVRTTLDAAGRPVSAAWVEPDEAAPILVVAHGAGAGMHHPFVAGFCRALVAHGIATMRFNFPYVEAGRRSPDAEGVLRATWLAAFEAAAAHADGRPVLAGGKSLGGRIASMVVADGMSAAGLVFLGYPLHPPGRPERIRDEHLDRIAVPMLFVQGTADPFARPELLRSVLERLGDRATYVPVEGGDHSFKVRGQKREDREIGAGLATIAGPWIHRVVRHA